MAKCRYKFIKGIVPQGRYIINRRFQPAEKRAHLRSKSRRDGPEFNSGLLTAGFNLRKKGVLIHSKSRRDDTSPPLRMVINPELNSGSSFQDFFEWQFSSCP